MHCFQKQYAYESIKFEAEHSRARVALLDKQLREAKQNVDEASRRESHLQERLAKTTLELEHERRSLRLDIASQTNDVTSILKDMQVLKEDLKREQRRRLDVETLLAKEQLRHRNNDSRAISPGASVADVRMLQEDLNQASQEIQRLRGLL